MDASQPVRALRFIVISEIDSEVVKLVRDLVANLSKRREWRANPPQFIDEVVGAERQEDARRNLGGSFALQFSAQQATPEISQSLQLFEEVDFIIHQLCEFSFSNRIDFGIDLNDEELGMVDNGGCDLSVVEFLSGWRTNLGAGVSLVPTATEVLRGDFARKEDEVVVRSVPEVIADIGRQLTAAMSEADVSSRAVTHLIHDYGQMGVSITDERGNVRKTTKFVEIALFEELRKAMYRAHPEKGAFYTVVATVNRERQLSTKFEYEDRSGFSLMPSDEEFAEDLRLYPRGGK